MTEPTTSELGEILAKFRGAQPKPSDKESWDNLAKLIEQKYIRRDLIERIIKESLSHPDYLADKQSQDFSRGFKVAMSQFATKLNLVEENTNE